MQLFGILKSIPISLVTVVTLVASMGTQATSIVSTETGNEQNAIL